MQEKNMGHTCPLGRSRVTVRQSQQIRTIFKSVHKNIIDVLSISFLKILGAKHNPVRSSSDQHLYFLVNFKHNFLLQ